MLKNIFKIAFLLIFKLIFWLLNVASFIGSIAVLLYPIFIVFTTGDHWALIHLLYSWMPATVLFIFSLALFVFNVEIMDVKKIK